MLTRRSLLKSLLVTPPGLTLLNACDTFQPLKIGVHPWIGYDTLYLAEELGKLPASVQLVKHANSSEKIAPLRSGSLDGGAFTLDEVLLLQSQGVDLTIVAIMDISAGADLVLVKDITRNPLIYADQRIGFEQNQVGQLMLDLLLLHVGLSRDQVKLYPIPVGDNQVEAWQRGSVDAMITYEPTASKLKRLDGKVAFTSRDFPQRIFDVIAIRTDRLAHFQQAIKALIKVHFAMLQRFQQQPDDTLYRIASRQRISYHEAKHALHGVILPSLSKNHQLLEQNQGQLQQAIVHLQQIMNLAPQQKARSNSAPFYSPYYLPSIVL